MNKDTKEEYQKCTDTEHKEYYVSSPDYGELIIEMIHKIDNKDYLVNIYYFVKGMYDKCKK